MTEQWGWALLVLSVGTFLLRMLPLWWTRRHLQRQRAATAAANQADAGMNGDANRGADAGASIGVDSTLQLPLWLTVLGPAMIAAMLGVSLLPAPLTSVSLLATVLATLVTVLTWRRTRSLGWPVVLGVCCYGCCFVVLQAG